MRLNNQGRYGPMANHKPKNSAHRGGNYTRIRPVVVACFYSAGYRKRKIESAMQDVSARTLSTECGR